MSANEAGAKMQAARPFIQEIFQSSGQSCFLFGFNEGRSGGARATRIGERVDQAKRDKINSALDSQ